MLKLPKDGESRACQLAHLEVTKEQNIWLNDFAYVFP